MRECETGIFFGAADGTQVCTVYGSGQTHLCFMHGDTHKQWKPGST